MSEHILVVEDESVLRLTFAQFLQDEGYVVEAAEGYNEAVELLEQHRFDIVVTDIILAGKTGVDLLRTIHERDLRCITIMITGEPNVESAAEAVRLGAFDYLSKPVTGRELKRVVRLALEQRKIAAERDHFAARMDLYRRELEAIFHSVNEGILTVDAELRVRQVNSTAEQILGIDPDNGVSGKLAAEVLGPGLESVLSALKETIAKRKPVIDIRIAAKLPSKEQKVLVMSTMPLVDDSGVQMGAVLLVRDVTRLTLLEKQLEDPHQYQNIVGKSPKMRDIFELIENVAETDSTVLLWGESGTGKELLAAAVHNVSPRAKKPFIKVNCAALSEDILESELFGHVKGAFTGAVKDRMGRFEAADGGTILLDEIGDVSHRLQLRLLRVLQEREFERVGDSVPIHVDVRIVASSNQDLMQKIRNGEFREDLYYRLNVVRIEIPPLRDRRDDIPLLVDHMCRRFNSVFKKEIMGLAPESMEIVMKHPWWGNIRELENAIERAFIVCHDSVILPSHLPPDIISYGHGRPLLPVVRPVGGRKEPLSREHILEVLRQTDWNVAKASRILGVARNTLYQKMRTFNVSRMHEGG